MIELNKVVLSVIACLENSSVVNKINKNYELKIKKLQHYSDYTNSDDFKTKVINELNFDNCVSFAIKQLSDEKFRVFVQRNNICIVAFYKRDSIDDNLLAKTLNRTTSIMDSLSSIIVKYYIEDNIAYMCVNPVLMFKQHVLSKKDELLKYFKDNNKEVSDIKVKFIHNDVILDDLSEAFLDLGYNIK